MTAHHCDVPHCDGTRLGHDLAVEFPGETARFDAAMDTLRASARMTEPCDACPFAGCACQWQNDREGDR